VLLDGYQIWISFMSVQIDINPRTRLRSPDSGPRLLSAAIGWCLPLLVGCRLLSSAVGCCRESC